MRPVIVPWELPPPDITGPLLDRVLQRRQRDHGFLRPVATFERAPRIPGMEAGCDLMVRARDEGWPVAVIGDPDPDGAYSIAVAVRGLRRGGLRVTYHMPQRSEGHGLAEGVVRKMAEEGVRLLLVVDCGSSDRDSVALARQLGMRVVICDHHPAPAQRRADPDALINVTLSGTPEEFVNLCGAGVTFTLLGVLASAGAIPPVSDLLPLVACAELADVMQIEGLTRRIVDIGLRHFRDMTCLATLANAGVGADGLSRIGPVPTSAQVTFDINPPLSAAIRLADSGLVVRLLLSDDPAECRELATVLHGLNAERKRHQEACLKEATAQVEQLPESLNVIFLSQPHWKDGVTGVAASGLAETYQRACYLGIEDGDLLHASGRRGGHPTLTQLMEAVDPLMLRGGGHPEAAGLTIRRKDLPEVIERMDAAAAEQIGDRSPIIPLRIDAAGSLPTDHELEDLMRMEPTGNGFEKAVLLARVRVMAAWPGAKRNAYRVQDESGGRRRAVTFNAGLLLDVGSTIDLAYSPLGQGELRIEDIDGLSR